jgi:GTPase SAR1 family protein
MRTLLDAYTSKRVPEEPVFYYENRAPLRYVLMLLFAEPRENLPKSLEVLSLNSYLQESRIDSINISLCLSDVSSYQVYEQLRPLSYVMIDVFIICIDIDIVRHWEQAELKWIPEITRHCPDAPFLLVGIKNQKGRNRKNLWLETHLDRTKAYGKAFARSVGAARYVQCDFDAETYARTGIDNLFHLVRNLQQLQILIKSSSRGSQILGRMGSAGLPIEDIRDAEKLLASSFHAFNHRIRCQRGCKQFHKFAFRKVLLSVSSKDGTTGTNKRTIAWLGYTMRLLLKFTELHFCSITGEFI